MVKIPCQGDRNAYNEQCSRVNAMITEAKTQYLSDMVNKSSSQKELFGVINKIMHKNDSKPLPKHECPKELANSFATFFDEKIKKIHTALEQSNAAAPPVELIPSSCNKTIKPLTTFTPVTQEEIRKISMHAASKTCALDPIPTWLVKESLDVLLPVITDIVNKSLVSGKVPASMKTALVIPLLKKLLLDWEILKNYRPVSNLSFVSKVIEKVVSIQTYQHTKANNLDTKFQSAYKKGHSTETALIRVQNDFLMAADQHKAGLLVLLDLSAAFDTIDHKLMLSNLQYIHGIEGTALDWYKSYLSDRYQTVIINGDCSEPRKLECGLPQGSILGPEMYLKYTKGVAEIVEKHGLLYHLYADDTQLYIFFDVEGTEEAIRRVELCVSEIRLWLQKHMLKQNDEKTEVVLMGLKSTLKKVPNITVHIGDESIPPTESVRNIGVVMDRHITMKEHVLATCKSANFQLYSIGRIRKYLTQDACKKLVHAFVTSKLDYANALLYGVPDYLLKKLQAIQNTAARIIYKLPKFSHISHKLKDLHWLPIKERIKFKILLITYKALNGHAPAYISELLPSYHDHIPRQRLRSNTKMMLQEPRTELVTYGDRAFAKVAPRLWNTIPVHIKSAQTVDVFKQKLKAHLFNEAYN